MEMKCPLSMVNYSNDGQFKSYQYQTDHIHKQEKKNIFNVVTHQWIGVAFSKSITSLQAYQNNLKVVTLLSHPVAANARRHSAGVHPLVNLQYLHHIKVRFPVHSCGCAIQRHLFLCCLFVFLFRMHLSNKLCYCAASLQIAGQPR